MPKTKNCAIVLAAGEGARMGYTPKCLLALDGQTFLHRQLRSLREAGIGLIYVVTGFYHQQIESTLLDESVNILRNPAPQDGQQSSVSLALEAIDNECDLIVIALADQPLINAGDLRALISAFIQRETGKEIMYPVAQGQRGNPVLLSGRAHALFLKQPDWVTCREFIDAHPEVVQRLQTDNSHFFVDIDTPEDLERLRLKS